MPHRFPAHWAQRLLDPQRFAWHDPDDVLDWIGLERGETVLDLGCGPGFFSLPAARRVAPEGRVLALDISRPMLRVLAERAAGEQRGEILPIHSGPVHLPLVGPVADRALLANVFHDLDRPQTSLREVLSVLRPGGTVGILDWREDQGEPGPPRDRRAKLSEIERAAREAGFEIEGPPRHLRHHVFLKLRSG